MSGLLLKVLWFLSESRIQWNQTLLYKVERNSEWCLLTAEKQQRTAIKHAKWISKGVLQDSIIYKIVITANY